MTLTLGALSLGTGCASETDEDLGVTCTARANAKKQKHLESCRNGALEDTKACVATAYATVRQHTAELRRLESTWTAEMDRIVDQCVAASNACPADPAVEALVAAGYPREKLPARACTAAIDTARSACAIKVEPTLKS